MSILAVTGLLREAKIIQGDGIVTLSGGGDSAGLSEKIGHRLSGDVHGLISIGIAGALVPSLQVGDVVIGISVVVRGVRHKSDERWTSALRQSLPHALCGDAFGSDLILTEPQDKAAVHAELGACTVDMESHIVAAAANKAKLPFAVLRVISDSARRSLPGAVTLGMKPNGKMNLGGVLNAIMASPTQISALIRTGFETEAAFRSLLRCRRVLGSSLGFPDLL